MCQTYPRPRCSHHSWEKLQTETVHLQELLQEAKKYKRAPSLLTDKIVAQEGRVSLAQRQFDCTKRGLQELREKVAQTAMSQDYVQHASYRRSLERAQEDAVNHKAAGKLYDAYKDCLDASEEPSVKQIAQQRTALAGQIAYIQANNTAHQAAVLSRKYNTLVSTENKEKKKFLFRQRGITRPTLVEDPQHTTQEVYAFLPSYEFGHLANEFPQGVYARVTNIIKTSEGNFQGLVEGVKEVTFPAKTPFIVNRQG